MFFHLRRFDAIGHLCGISTQMLDRIETSQVKKHRQLPMTITKLKKKKKRKTKTRNPKNSKNIKRNGHRQNKHLFQGFQFCHFHRDLLVLFHLRRFYAIGTFVCKSHKNVDRMKNPQVEKHKQIPMEITTLKKTQNEDNKSYKQ